MLRVKIKHSHGSNQLFVAWPSTGGWHPLGMYVYNEQERPGPINDHIRGVSDLMWYFCSDFNRHLELPMKNGQEIIFELAVRLAPEEVK